MGFPSRTDLDSMLAAQDPRTGLVGRGRRLYACSTMPLLSANSGRIVGTQVVGDANWDCTKYDDRGRVTLQSATDAKTIAHD